MMKKSFMLHIDSLCILDELTDEQKGELFYAIYKYQLGEEIELSSIIKIAFSQFKNQFIRDNEKYEKTCEARKIAGSKGGKQRVANQANATNCKQNQANQADSNNKKDSKKDSNSNNNSNNITTKVVDVIDIPSWLDFRSWNDWEQHRKEIKKKLTKSTRDKQIKFLEKHKDNHIKIIEQSIMNGWTGLFELKDTKEEKKEWTNY